MSTAISTGSTLNRSTLPIPPADPRGMLCAPCLKQGHRCPAFQIVDHVAVCAYCIDNDVCPHKSEIRIQGRLPEPKPIASSLTKLRPAKRTAAVVPAPPGPSPNPKKEPSMERFCKCKCGGVVPASSRFSYLPGHMKRNGKSAAAPPSIKRKVGRPRNNATNGHGDARPANGHAPINGNGHDVSTNGNRATVGLQVTEPQLNRFLLGLPLDRKQFLANYHLRSEAEVS